MLNMRCLLLKPVLGSQFVRRSTSELGRTSNQSASRVSQGRNWDRSKLVRHGIALLIVGKYRNGHGTRKAVSGCGVESGDLVVPLAMVSFK